MSVLRRRSTPQYGGGASWSGLPVDDAGSLGFASGGGGYYDRLTDHRRSSGPSSVLPSLSALPSLSPRARLLLGLLLALAPWAHHAIGAGRVRGLQRELADADLAQQQLQADLQKAKRDLERLAAARAAEEVRSHDLLTQLHAAGDTVLDADDGSAAAAPDYRAQLAEEAPYLERIKEIESALARKLAAMATTKHGNGPFHVVVTLTAEPRPGVGRSFMIETVPTNAMPLSVGQFVRLVERRIWDGLALLHSHQGANVVQTAEIVSDGARRPDADADPELHRLAYAERNPAYGIEKYSVAFAGKPGGPNFYIFMDKTFDPTSHLGEACFGKVIHGERVLDAIVDTTGQQTKTDIYGIESVRILPQEEI